MIAGLDRPVFFNISGDVYVNMASVFRYVRQEINWRNGAMSGRKEMLNIKVSVLLIIVIILAAGLLLLFYGKRYPIGENEAGVVVSMGGSYSIYESGEKPFVIPLFEKLYLISGEPVVLSFVDDDGLKVRTKGGKDLNIGSQVTYDISDIRKAVESYGFSDINAKIRKQLKEYISELLTKGFSEAGSIEDSGRRVSVMAETHISLIEKMKKYGINVSSFRIGYE